MPAEIGFNQLGGLKMLFPGGKQAPTRIFVLIKLAPRRVKPGGLFCAEQIFATNALTRSSMDFREVI